jgi:hypothetical protein
MLRKLGAVASFLVLVAHGACGGSTSAAGPSTSGPIDLDSGGPPVTGPSGPSGLPCDVDKILATHCRKCHSAPPQYGAPMPLMTWENLHARAVSDESKNVYDLVPLKIANDAAPMPPPPNPRLSDADRKVLADWAAAGAPRGPDSCESTTVPDAGPLVACTPDLTLEPESPWEMPEDSGDEYVCWGAELTRPTPTHITAFAPKIDNTKIVHHVVLYEAPSAFSRIPAKCSGGGSLQWRMVMGWAPGAKGIELPKEAGFPIATTGATHYVMQVHYSNPQKLKGEKDSSKMELCTAPPRQYEADVIAFGTQSISIPPAPPPGGVFTRDCKITVQKVSGVDFAGLHLFAAMPHMHKIGVSISTTLTPKAGGPDVDLGTDPTFSFSTQSWIPLNAVTANGDIIRTQCGWTNTTGAEVGYGENTADEMCYSFTMYYPKIKAPLWSWAAPALTSSCVSKP